jgi:thymidylate kinase
MSNIIAFSGTHGVGKTTQAYRLASNLKLAGQNVAVIDELARECPLPINKESDILTQYWIISAQIKREIELMSRYDYVIADRTIMDTLAYAVALGQIWLTKDSQLIPQYIKKYYKLIIILDPEKFQYQIADGVRDMDPTFRYGVHTWLVRLYNLFDIPYIVVGSDAEIDDLINQRIMWRYYER